MVFYHGGELFGFFFSSLNLLLLWLCALKGDFRAGEGLRVEGLGSV